MTVQRANKEETVHQARAWNTLKKAGDRELKPNTCPVPRIYGQEHEKLVLRIQQDPEFCTCQHWLRNSKVLWLAVSVPEEQCSVKISGNEYEFCT